MSSTGKPSREQLEEHYKNSRKYFDDLAEHYKDSDPDYYSSVIEPIIRKNKFGSQTYNQNLAKGSLMVTVVGALLVLGIAMAVFFILSPEQEETNPVDKMLEKVDEENPQKIQSPLREIKPGIETEKDPSLDGEVGSNDKMSNYEKGVFYYDQAAYDRAMEYFGKVKPGDPNYDAAQKYLSEISRKPDDERGGAPPTEDEAPPIPNPNKK